MSFEIVTYASEYQYAVVELLRKCGLVVPQNHPVVDIQKKVDFQPELFFVALLEGRVIGSVMVGYEGHRGWMNYLAVLPDYQKQGYGRKLGKKHKGTGEIGVLESQPAGSKGQSLCDRLLQASRVQR